MTLAPNPKKNFRSSLNNHEMDRTCRHPISNLTSSFSKATGEDEGVRNRFTRRRLGFDSGESEEEEDEDDIVVTRK